MSRQLLPSSTLATNPDIGGTPDPTENFLGLKSLADEIADLQNIRANGGALGSTYALNQSLAMRELGFDAQMRKMKRKTDAVTNPAGWLEEKRVDLEGIQGQVANFYIADYEKRIENGYGVDEAKEKAKKGAKSYMAALLSNHEEDYPTKTADALRSKAEIRFN